MAEKNRLQLLVPQEKQPGQGCIPPLSPLLHGSGNSPSSSPENLTVAPPAMDNMQRQQSMESLASSSSDDAVIEEAPETSDTRVVNVSGEVESGQQPAQIKREALLAHPRFRRERKISVRRPRKASSAAEKMEVVKEGYLMQQGRTFQRWAKKYLTITGDRLFITKTPEDKLQEEITLKGLNIAENSTKNVNHSFTILTPFQQVALAANSRKEMEEWISAFKVAASKTKQAGVLEALQHLEGQHSWFTCSHARRTYCNVCREALHGVAWHGLSCEVCKFKSHRRCVFAVKQPCKWTTRANLDEAGVSVGPDFSIPHQWLEGNLPTGSKCIVCERACGSPRRLQDFKCMWCKWTVHTECVERVTKSCTLGDHRLSILPPSALQRSDSIKKGMWEPNKMSGRSPVLALVNSKSGENLGVKFLRKLKYWLNPVQVFDLAISGPDLGLQLFQRFEKFRIIVMGGDGSIGWVLSAVDKLNLHSKCMLGVVPLGTGNDLARVMGWGARCDDEEKIPSILTDMEHSSFKLLDRWTLQFTEDKEVDVSPLLRQNSISATSATKLPQSRSPVGALSPGVGSPPKPTTTAQLQSLAPFPGPSTAPGQPAVSPDPVFSPQDSVTSSSDGENRSPSPLQVGGRNVNNGTDFPDGRVTGNRDHDRRRSRESTSSPEPGTNRFAGCSQTPQKVEVFHGSLVAHLSTILLSDNEKAVIASAQVLCSVVRDFISSVVADREQRLPASDFVNDPFVHRCTELHGKLKGLLMTLKDEAESVTNPEKSSNSEGKVFRPREALMTRANSLKKAVRAVFDMTEKVVDSQAETTAEIEALTRNGYGGPAGTERVNGVKTSRPRPRRQKSDSTSSHGSVVDPVPLMLPETREIACMNNYFGIGLDAKITYLFNTTREKNPAQYKSRTKNMLLYATLGGRELFTNTQRYLERRIELECDGKVFQLPQRLQGLVFLNIPSYMAGTNFWGTKEEKEGFSAPSHDDKLLEVVGITGMTQVATSKVLGIQNRRITQCRVAKLTLNGSEKFPVQVDGEAWLQDPGTVIVSHKNKARMLVKDKAFTQSLESWKQKNPNSHSTPSLAIPANMPTVTEALTTEELGGFQKLAAVVKPLLACIKEEAAVSSEAARVLMPHVSTAMASLERVFPNDQASETADVEHLQDFERDVKALLQETLWFLSVRRVSSEREQQMKEYSHATEIQMKVLLCGESDYCSLAQHNLRRASDTFLTSARPRQVAAKSSVPLQDQTDAIPRARASQLMPDDAVSGPEAAERIGKDIEDWDTDDVCRWLQEMQLQEYQPLMRQHNMTGKKLMDYEKSDLKKLGITKVTALSRINHGLQSLTCSSLDTLLRNKRKNGGSRDKTL